MNIKEKIENRPFIYLLTAVVAAVSVSAGIQQFFYSQQKEIVKEECDNDLASIKRGLDKDDSINIKNLQYTASSSNQPPSASKFYAAEQFYATTKSSWSYSVTTETAMLQDMTNLNAANMPIQIQQAVGLVPVHLWKETRRTVKVDNHPVFVHLFPLVAVETIDFEQLHKLFGAFTADDNDTNKSDAKDPKQVSQVSSKQPSSALDKIAPFERYFRADLVGAFFTSQLYGQMLSSVGNVGQFSLLDVQKVGNVLYSQSLLTLSNVKIDGKKYERYYIRRELIFISASDKLYTIQTFVPSDDPSARGEAFSDITNWLADFRILTT